jgi:hypothetical protein
MVFTSALGINANGGANYYTRAASKDGDSSSAKSDTDKAEAKDYIDLNAGENLKDKIRNAKSTDDLVELLSKGQEEARTALAKFDSLLNKNKAAYGDDLYAKRQGILFEATHKTVMEIIVSQTETFEARLMTNIRDLDPDFFDDVMKDARNMFGYSGSLDQRDQPDDKNDS